MDINSSTLEPFFVGISAAFAEGLGVAGSQYEKIAMVVPSSSATNVYPWLGSLPSMREWAGDRVIRNLTSHTYSIENKRFESTVSVKREHLEDDQYNIYGPMFRDLGAQAGLHPNQLVFGLLKQGHTTPCYDGKNFFDAEHPVGEGSASNLLGDGSAEPWYLMCTSRPVKPLIFQKRRDYSLTRKDTPNDENAFMRDEYLYGVDARVNVGFGLWQFAIRVTSDLTAENYAKARAQMMALTNDNGEPLGLVPDLLVVPPAHEAAARKTVVCTLTPKANPNEWAGTAELIVSPWLV